MSISRDFFIWQTVWYKKSHWLIKNPIDWTTYTQEITSKSICRDFKKNVRDFLLRHPLSWPKINLLIRTSINVPDVSN